ncbi:MAG: hypothetical protein CVV44_03010 [Spirochaetae bacterium HGW-Spirochaetae-1]|jgi:hypothetical protein|nr:MAG: hypothetical protein CVV44_03010 [Spirochaetae bacterium HGW-Spirochaetae-1]
MKKGITIITQLAIWAAVAFISCSSAPINDESMNNFTHRGFINDDCFQTVITESPDKDTGGLVEQRESAFLKAKVGCPETAINDLVEYICAKNIHADKPGENQPAINPVPARQKIEASVRRYIQYGYIAEEYYREDYSVVLVYRIRKSGLRRDIDSIECK